MITHDTEMPLYLSEEFEKYLRKFGRIEKANEIACLRAAHKERADKPAHAPSIADGEVAEAIVWVRNMMATVENTAPQDHAAVEALIRAADRCIDAEFSLSCAEKRIAELEEEAANYRYRLADHAKLAEEITCLKAQITAADDYIDKCPCDPDITEEQAKAWENYRSTKGDKNV